MIMSNAFANSIPRIHFIFSRSNNSHRNYDKWVYFVIRENWLYYCNLGENDKGVGVWCLKAAGDIVSNWIVSVYCCAFQKFSSQSFSLANDEADSNIRSIYPDAVLVRSIGWNRLRFSPFSVNRFVVASSKHRNAERNHLIKSLPLPTYDSLKI